MTTAAQRKANKQNAQHSTGPRTEQGKQRSSQNALKHGFRAKDPLIPGEDPDHYYRHSAELESELQPAGPLEKNLVDQIVDITWRLKRFARIEAAGSKAKTVEPTQSTTSPLGSTTPMNAPPSAPDSNHNPSRLDVAQFHRTNPQDPARTGNQEAAA